MNMIDRANQEIGAPIEKVCVDCGNKFLTKDVDETLCIGCKISKEMKLPKDTIINQNVLNIYMSGNYDKVKGVDKYYLIIAEGVLLVNHKQREERLCSKIRFIGEKQNDEIESYVKNGVEGNSFKKQKYDALVFIKVNAHSKFMTFGIKYSDRLYNKLIKHDIVFQKNYAISLAVNWMYKK